MRSNHSLVTEPKVFICPKFHENVIGHYETENP